VRVVVGAALITSAGGLVRVLAGERSAPADLAGRWEFPGGKVEDGETDAEALVRECREELGVDIAVGDRIGADVAIPGGRILRVYAATLVAGAPTPIEHRRLRWLSAAQLNDVPWLPTNVGLLGPLAVLLQQPVAG
jgi:8-oxo-dGTP diphosphatase